ncbi:unnamed protein product [Blepharisma stoltei]|uniref:AAA-ATPase-like domain-containing protein n=1 Tax=Blepharisma stoltei TaxID=1481888 RepID=A0AAU9J9T0_9CILI|nr:unnamed protein product [Blepharisma stoltei]
MISLKQDLYTVFSNLDTYDRLSKTKCYASAFGIQEALKRIYQDKIHIIGSELTLINSPAIDDDEVIGVLSYTKKIEEAIANDGEKLKRPIVAYWKLDVSKNSNLADEQIEQKYIWQTMVVIPKDYININGEHLYNPSELVFSIDSSGNNYSLPPLLKYLLCTKISYNEPDGQSATFGGFFKTYWIFDHHSIKMYKHCLQSCLLSMYNIVMLISTGKSAFLDSFSQFDLKSAYKITALFEQQSIIQILTQNCEIGSWDFELNWLEWIKDSISNELKRDMEDWVISEVDAGIILSKLSMNQLCILRDFKEKGKKDMAHKFIQSLNISPIPCHNIFQTPISKNKKLKESPTTPQSVIRVQSSYNFSTSNRNFKLMIDDKAVYVDKTIFIKAILDDTRRNFAILRPRGWGKTLNLTMLKTFLNPEQDENGQFANLYLFTGGKNNTDLNNLDSKKCFEIMNADNGHYRQFAGCIPTIFFAFPDLVKIFLRGLMSPEILLQKIQTEISRVYKEHISSYCQYLEKIIEQYGVEIMNYKNRDVEVLEHIIDRNEIILPAEIKLFRTYRQFSSQIDINIALENLAHMLHIIHRQAVIVIIDGYDKNFNRGLTEDNQNEIELLLWQTMQQLVDHTDHCIKKLIVAGYYYDTLLEIFSPDAFFPYTISTKSYSKFFGFTEADVEWLLNKHLIEYSDRHLMDQKTLIKDWYNGYNVGGHKIYNSRSIISCLKLAVDNNEWPLSQYWNEFDNDGRFLTSIFEALKFDNELFDIMKAGYLELKNPIINQPWTANNPYLLLLHAGYLTLLENKKEINVLVVPNKEVRKYFYPKMLNVWLKITGENQINSYDWLDKFVENLEHKDEVSRAIQEEILDKISERTDKSEKFFQTIVGGAGAIPLLTSNDPKYFIGFEISNKFKKKLDGIFISKRGKGDVAIIHEYKKLGEAEISVVCEKAHDALWQICAKKYIEVVLNPNYDYLQRMIIRGIVFYRNIVDGKWEIHIDEHQFSIKVALDINNHFSTSKGKIFPESSILCRENDVTLTNEKRIEFGDENIERLIQKIKEKDSGLEIIRNKLREKEEEGNSRKRKRNIVQKPEKRFKKS